MLKLEDYIVRAIDEKGTIRLLVASSTNIVEEARKTHNTSASATAALGRTLTASSIMGLMMKGDEDTLTLQIKGNGPLGKIVTVSNSLGKVKGYVDNPVADLPSKSKGKLDVGGVVGKDGILTVIRDLGLKEPYIGQSNLISGEIAEDLTYYFANSEQQPSVVSLGVLVDVDLSVKAAGGYILQLLPEVSGEDIDRIEKNIKKSKPISTMIDNGYTPEKIIDEVFGDFNMEILEKHHIYYECDCSKERVEKALVSLGKKEIEDIIKEDGGA
ncbi:MAG TPA: Hsp33 family molecular chaperone HslO, partial [Tissierellales bacterium]|nr:Hsp33 family molecular chaperone HslO [Tissierellales bacterium]